MRQILAAFCIAALVGCTSNSGQRTNTEAQAPRREDPAPQAQGGGSSGGEALDTEWQRLRDQCLAEARTVRNDVDSFVLVDRRTDEEGNRFVYFQLQSSPSASGGTVTTSSDDHFACRISPAGEVLLLLEG